MVTDGNNEVLRRCPEDRHAAVPSDPGRVVDRVRHEGRGVPTRHALRSQHGQAGHRRRVKLVKQPALSYHTLMLNGRRGPLKKQMVRQAIACAVDRKQVLQTAAYGDGTVTGPITSPAYSYSATDGLPCQPGDLTRRQETAEPTPATRTGSPSHDRGDRRVCNRRRRGAEPAGATDEDRRQPQAGQLPTSPYVTAWLGPTTTRRWRSTVAATTRILMYGRYSPPAAAWPKPAGLRFEQPSIAAHSGQRRQRSMRSGRAIFGNCRSSCWPNRRGSGCSEPDDYYLVGQGRQRVHAAPTSRSPHWRDDHRTGAACSAGGGSPRGSAVR